jgi:L-malate glycosyltransferase
MKVLFLASSASTHTVKWVCALAAKGIDVCVLGLNSCPPETYASFPNVSVVSLGFSSTLIWSGQANYRKLRYLNALPLLWRTINSFKPDIVHAHYASSYGLLCALSGFHPRILSVWGGDVFVFPNVSFVHRWFIQFNLLCADKILSTSKAMAQETNKYTSKNIEVTPFGIDLAVFKPQAVVSLFAPDAIVIGTVKALEPVYGIDYLIRAFHQISQRHPVLALKLLIVGGGSLEQSLKTLVHDLKLSEHVVFTGRVSHDDVPRYHNMLSISVSVSNSESFGVSIIEASACEKPVIVSNVGGLPEVVEDGVTGIVVPPRDISATAVAIERLIQDTDLRLKMGKAGRERVQRLYDWNENVTQMIDIYNGLVNK